jgi:uncharacterized protein YbaP (TraB family)
MHKKITLLDLILYSYNKCNFNKSKIKSHRKLRKKILCLNKLQNQLDKLQNLPSSASINSILKYGRSIASVNSNFGRFVYFTN